MGVRSTRQSSTSGSPSELGGDSGGKTNTSSKKPTKVDLSQFDLVVPMADTKTLTGTVTDSDGTKDSSLRWSTSDETIVAIDSKGKLTALKDGQATIIASGIGDSSVKAQAN